jgi:hypothetical protein
MSIGNKLIITGLVLGATSALAQRVITGDPSTGGLSSPGILSTSPTTGLNYLYTPYRFIMSASEYGVAGDGADHTVQLNNAINAAMARGGYVTILLPSGKIGIKSTSGTGSILNPITGPGICIEGQAGMGPTELDVLTGDTTPTIFQFGIDQYSAATPNPNIAQNACLRNLYINFVDWPADHPNNILGGTRPTLAGYPIWLANTADMIVSDVRVYNTPGGFMRLGAANGAAARTVVRNVSGTIDASYSGQVSTTCPGDLTTVPNYDWVWINHGGNNYLDHVNVSALSGAKNCNRAAYVAVRPTIDPQGTDGCTPPQPSCPTVPTAPTPGPGFVDTVWLVNSGFQDTLGPKEIPIGGMYYGIHWDHTNGRLVNQWVQGGAFDHTIGIAYGISCGTNCSGFLHDLFIGGVRSTPNQGEMCDISNTPATYHITGMVSNPVGGSLWYTTGIIPGTLGPGFVIFTLDGPSTVNLTGQQFTISGASPAAYNTFYTAGSRIDPGTGNLTTSTAAQIYAIPHPNNDITGCTGTGCVSITPGPSIPTMQFQDHVNFTNFLWEYVGTPGTGSLAAVSTVPACNVQGNVNGFGLFNGSFIQTNTANNFPSAINMGVSKWRIEGVRFGRRFGYNFVGTTAYAIQITSPTVDHFVISGNTGIEDMNNPGGTGMPTGMGLILEPTYTPPGPSDRVICGNTGQNVAGATIPTPVCTIH